MKVLHIPYTFYPNKVGGTEIVVLNLAKELIKQNIESIIVYPSDKSSNYIYEEIKVRSYATNTKISDLSQIYGSDNDLIALESFAGILEEEKPDIVHFHSLTSKLTEEIIKKIKSLNIPIVFTYHTPTVTCQRGTLMKWGEEVCDGVVDLDICTKCTLNGLGLPKQLANMFGNFPFGEFLEKNNLSGGLWTALRMKKLIEKRQSYMFWFLNQVDYITTVCNWSKDILIRNSMPENKISVIRHGLNENDIKVGSFNSLPAKPNSKLRLAFIGRITSIKGLHILIQAIKNLSGLSLSLDIYGIVQSNVDQTYLEKLKRLVSLDKRIEFQPGLENKNVIETIKNYDLLTVPSQCLETGPLVVLEAFKVGVPVIGSDLGGIAELVQNNVNGLLIKYDSVNDWAKAIEKVSYDRNLISRLRNGIKSVRLMKNMASDFLEIYKRFAKVAC